MRPEYPDVYGAITTGVTAREAAGIPEGSRLPGICHLTGTAQVIPHNRNLPPVKVWRAVSRLANGNHFFYGCEKFGDAYAVISSGAGYFQLPVRIGTDNEVVEIRLS